MSSDPIFQHPLAYLLGLEGIALMRAYAGEYDRDFTVARLAEVRALIDRADQFGDGVVLPPLRTDDGYDAWAPSYDGENPFFAMDEGQLLPAVADMVWLPVADHSVDVVVDTLVLNHVEDLALRPRVRRWISAGAPHRTERVDRR